MNMINFSQNMLATFDGSYPVFPRPALPAWIEIASSKGFDLVGRIDDRLHLALRCRKCGAVHKSRLFTLMSAQPSCPACIEVEWRNEAETAGLEFLGRDPEHRHYAIYQAPCGHEIRRQTGLIKRMAAGKTGVRCEICHAEIEAAEARARGWTLIGADSDSDPNYRLYHHGQCGHEQRIARINMRNGRFACHGCDAGWAASPSYLYAMSFTLASSRDVVKLGYSRNPQARLTSQLCLDPEMPCDLLRTVQIASGHAALSIEKGMHARLRREHPEAVLLPSSWQGQINVHSEIYDGALTPLILQMLDEIEGQSLAA